MMAGAPIPQRAAGADVVALWEKNVAEIADFIAVQSGRTRDTVEGHLRWFLLENPARRPQDPLGFGLRSTDRLVGCILCSPQIFCFESQEILLMGSSSFYVDEGYRGYGGRIFLQYSRLAKQRPIFGTSANAEAAALWKAVGASPIPFSDAELFGVLRWPPVAEEFMQRRYSVRVLSWLAGTSISNLAALIRPLKIEGKISGVLEPLASAEQVNDLVTQHSSSKLSARRDLAYIRWRYFSGTDETIAAFEFRGQPPDRQVLVTVNQRPRGYRGQMKTLNVLDVYPGVSPDEWLHIVGALIDRYGKTVDAIVLRCQTPAQETLFCKQGFQRRPFDAPLGWFLDKAGLLPSRDWYPVPADGDGLI
jgi:hypothetical protein